MKRFRMAQASLSCLVLVLLTVVPVRGEAADEAQQLKQRVLDSRISLADGHAEFTSIDVTGRKVHWSAWFKGTDRLRVDQGNPPHKMLRVGGDLFDCAVVPGGPVIQPVRRNLDDPVKDVFDFRLLGIAVSTTTSLRSSRLEDFMTDPYGIVRPEIEEVERDGRKLMVVTADFPKGTVARHWIDPDRGPSVVQAEVEFEANGKHYRDQVVSRLHNYDGVWFPDRVVYSRFVNNSPSGSTYVTTIERAEFNTGLQDELFTLGAIGVPPGTAVQEFPPFPGGQRIWDGSELVLMSAPAENAPGAPGWWRGSPVCP